MIEQRIQNRSLQGWRGIALVLATALAVVLGSSLLHALEPRIGTASSVLFIAYGCAIAWFLLHWFVMGFIYHCDGSCLRVYRVYGKRRRPMLEIWLNSVRACGEPEEMKRRFPGARMQRAVRRECPIAPLALAWNDGGKAALLLFQPDDAMRAAVMAAAKRK